MCVSVAVIQRRAMPMKMNRAEFRCVQIVFVGKVIHKVIVNLYTVEVWEVHFCVSDVLLILFKFLNTFLYQWKWNYYWTTWSWMPKSLNRAYVGQQLINRHLTLRRCQGGSVVLTSSQTQTPECVMCCLFLSFFFLSFFLTSAVKFPECDWHCAAPT